VNQGGEPAHDDYGLPRVDIEIPDDARELDRDVQAYHRELRALRRIERSNRLRAPLRKSGMLVPLIAGGLVLAMIAGMVLTMFSANPNFPGLTGRANAPVTARRSAVTGPPSAGPRGSASAPFRSRSAAGSAAGPRSLLPNGIIAAADRTPIRLRSLITAAIAIIPANCHCANIIGSLIARAHRAGVKVYLVGLNGSNVRELRALTPPSANAVLAIDKKNVLATAYLRDNKASLPLGLTVLLVNRHRHVTPVNALRMDRRLDRALRSLKS
jgi:hypothetical protein